MTLATVALSPEVGAVDVVDEDDLFAAGRQRSPTKPGAHRHRKEPTSSGRQVPLLRHGVPEQPSCTLSSQCEPL